MRRFSLKRLLAATAVIAVLLAVSDYQVREEDEGQWGTVTEKKVTVLGTFYVWSMTSETPRDWWVSFGAERLVYFYLGKPPWLDVS